MDRFTKGYMQMMIEMASDFYGFLMATSIKVIIRMLNGMVSK
jgi:hypothetical protein